MSTAMIVGIVGVILIFLGLFLKRDSKHSNGIAVLSVFLIIAGIACIGYFVSDLVSGKLSDWNRGSEVF